MSHLCSLRDSFCVFEVSRRECFELQCHPRQQALFFSQSQLLPRSVRLLSEQIGVVNSV